MSLKIKDVRVKYDQMRANLSSRADRVFVGITEEDGKEPHPNGRTTVLQVAIWTEFGNGLNSPERSYLRAWFDAHVEESFAKLVELSAEFFAGLKTKEQILNELGAWVEAEVKKEMDAGIPPPNASSTVARKGFNWPTVETGTLQASITHVVKKSGEK